jgi:hypothetical protein
LESNEKFTAKEIGLLMGNSSICLRLEALQKLAEYQVKVIIFPLQTNYIFAGLILTHFGNLKTKMNYKLPVDSDETSARFIKCIFHGMKQTPVPNNRRSACIWLRLRNDIDASPHVLRLDKYTPREGPGFSALWKRDYCMEKRGQTRQSATFGWVNKTMRPG